METGCEVQDYAGRLYQYFFVKDGSKRTPHKLIFIMTIHHFAAIGAVLPLNFYLRDSESYHYLLFCLQITAFFLLVLQNVSFIINVEKQPGLFYMQVISVLTFLNLLYSRVFGFCYYAYYLSQDAYANNVPVVYVCLIYLAFLLLGLFNVLIVIDAVKKLKKFLPMKPGEFNLRKHLEQDESFPRDTKLD